MPNGGAKIRRKTGRCKSLTGADGILICQVADNQRRISRPDGCRPLTPFASFIQCSAVCPQELALRACMRVLQPKRRTQVTPGAPPTDYQTVAAPGSRTNTRTNTRTNPFRQCFTPKAKNVQAARENFPASRKKISAARKCFTASQKTSRPLVKISRREIFLRGREIFTSGLYVFGFGCETLSPE